MDLVEELRKLTALHQSGAIDDEEFSLAKSRLLRPAGSPRSTPVEFDERDAARHLEEGSGNDPEAEPDLGRQRALRQWALLIHLSQFAGYMVPLGGPDCAHSAVAVEEARVARNRRPRQGGGQLDCQ